MIPFKHTELFLVRGIKSILFLIPFIPLYVSSSNIFPFITGKNFAFRVLVELAAALWLVLVYINKKEWFRNSPILTATLIFACIVGFADLLGVNPYRSFWSNYERMEGYITILHLVLYFMVMTNIFKTRRDWKRYFSIILLASLLVSLISFVITFNDNGLSSKRQIMEYGTREFGTVGNPPFLAAYLLIASFVGLLLIFQTQKRYLRLGCLIAVILNCAVIYLTATRGVILGGIAGIIVFIVLYVLGKRNRDRKSIIKIAAMVTLFTFACFSIAFFVINDNGSPDKFSTVYRIKTMFSVSSVATRLNAWEMALTAIKARPFLGWGQENFIAVYTVNPIPLELEGIWLDRAHNIVLEWLVNAGLLGLFAYLAIFGSALCALRKAYREKTLSRIEVLIIFSALVAYFIQNLLTFDTVNTYMIYFAFLAYIDNCAYQDKQVYSFLENDVDPKKIIRTMLVALICFSFSFYYLNYRPIKQSRYIIKMGISSPDNDSYALLLKDFNYALSFDVFGYDSVIEGMVNVSNQILKRRHFDQEGAIEFIGATLRELEKGIVSNKYNLDYLTDAINFLNNVAMHERSYIPRAEALIDDCLIINPEYHWLNLAMANIYILKKDYESAFASVKKVADLDPEDDKSQLNLALMAVYSSRDEVVEQALERVGRVRISKDKDILDKRRSFLTLSETYQFAQVYREIERYDMSLRYFKEVIAAMSDEAIYFDQDVLYYLPKTKARMMAQIHLDIAMIYLKLDDREAALREAETALKIDGNLSDARILIESINN